MARVNKRAVFLDRDGTINEEVGYLSDPGQVTLLPGAADALLRLKEAGLKLVVVTNQSGIARGYMGEDDLKKVNDELGRLLAGHGVVIDAYYFCPHHPNFTGECECRKPKTGMAMRAARELGIETAGSYFVGDKVTDVELGRNAGGKSVLVLTGFGKDERRLLDAKGIRPDMISDALPEAVDWILRDLKESS